jgi:hypothetical protein
MYYIIILFLFFEIFVLEKGYRIGSVIHNNPKDKEIFQENFHSLIHYIISCVMLLTLFIRNNKCFDKYFIMKISERCNGIITFPELYDITILFDISYYIVSLVHMYFYKKIKRKDEKIMYVHHFITLILMLCSYLVEFGKVGGIIVLLTHNICDIPLNLYIGINNLKKKIKINVVIENMVALLSVIIFGYNRLVIYGGLNLYLYYNQYNDILIPRVLLFVLYLFNVYWFGLMIKGIISEIVLKKDINFYS